jgi:hypothetical protein
VYNILSYTYVHLLVLLSCLFIPSLGKTTLTTVALTATSEFGAWTLFVNVLINPIDSLMLYY